MTIAIPDEVDLICPECGYDLRGIESPNCPECGQELDREKLRRSSIPWSYRHEIGAWKAYWRTVEMVIRRPGRIAADVTRQVSLFDAQKFRRVTALIAAIVPMALVIFFYVKSLDALKGPAIVSAMFGWQSEGPTDVTPPWYALGWLLEYATVAVMAGAVWLFFFAVCGVARYFFHPSWLPIARQNRAVALSYYACAPLALTPATAALAAVFLIAGIDNLYQRKSWAFFLASATALTIVTLLVQTIGTIAAPLRLLVRTTRCSGWRVLITSIAMPICWTILGAVILIGIPGAFAFISLVVLSLAP